MTILTQRHSRPSASIEEMRRVCGIAGFTALRDGTVDQSVLERMLSSLAHRGPDGSGVYVGDGIGFAHRRLSILDPTEAGHQPMKRGDVVLIHNGEIYNYLELAAELRDLGFDFSSESDTEVILAAYRAWGLAAFARFNGMWALALWDEAQRQLVLSRDRLGVKPLYFRSDRNHTSFASELSALIAGAPIGADDRWRPAPFLPVVRDFLVRGLVDHSVYTFIEGIEAVPPAHCLVVDQMGSRVVRYWGPPELTDDARRSVQGADDRRDRDQLDDFAGLFDDAVRLRLRSDVPVGTCLSGGIDSSAIVATAATILGRPRGVDRVDASAHEQQPRYAFHARFPDQQVDESRFADVVARTSGMSLVYRSPQLTPLFEALKPVLAAQGEPFAGSSVFAQYAVMAAAHDQGLKVLLDGQGADELLAGYLPYLGFRAASVAATGNVVSLAKELRAQVSFGSVGPGRALTGLIRGSVPPEGIERLRMLSRGRLGVQVAGELDAAPTLARTHSEPGTRLARRLWQDVASESLPALLRYEDRNSMAFGIESRTPFLDYRLVELTARMPDRLKIHNGATKWPLRRAMRGRLPSEVVGRRDKVGFATPQADWLVHGRTEIDAFLQTGQLVQRGWLTRATAIGLVADLSGARHSHEHVWRAFVLEAWLRTMWPGISHELQTVLPEPATSGR